uniref:Ig-like domain-containing protein n=1 Tax=Esox lucius TaxID=8010 RepID=A0A3P9A404_ESOLU
VLQVVIVTLGGDAQFSCRLMEPRDVLQVTWQKETPGENENVASYNKRFGPKVNPPFNMKVMFLYVGLQNCSVIIRRVSREDESCYKCLFNIYPDGAISGRTCLQVNVYSVYNSIHLMSPENNTTYNVKFSCRLMEPKDVLQVTWQKETPGGTENVASYNKRFGPEVNPPFNMKVLFLYVGLQNCSVIIRRVSREDESCYKCLFNIYPDGAIKLYGPTLLLTQNKDTHPLFSGLTVSCSATGRPAPVVDLFLPVQFVLENSTTVSVTHPNGTVTVTITSTVAVPSLPDNIPMVRCVVSSGSAIKEGSIKIPTLLVGEKSLLFMNST